MQVVRCLGSAGSKLWQLGASVENRLPQVKHLTLESLLGCGGLTLRLVVVRTVVVVVVGLVVVVVVVGRAAWMGGHWRLLQERVS